MELPARTFHWTAGDVRRYHLALGAGTDPTDPVELRYVLEPGLCVLPTFALTIPAMLGVAAPDSYRRSRPEIAYPGIELDLSSVLHARQGLVVRRPLPTDGEVSVRVRIADIYDKGSAAVVVQEATMAGADGKELVTAESGLYALGAGGFGGRRGPSAESSRVAIPRRTPDFVLDVATVPQQALLYQLCGERNPIHSDPAVAAAAGFPRPILQGVCLYGMVCKAIVGAMLGGDADRVVSYSVRFAGVVYPGETVRARVWSATDGLVLTASVPEREDALVLVDGRLVIVGEPAGGTAPG